MAHGGRAEFLATTGALSPGWAALVATGLPAAVMFLVLIGDGVAVTLLAVGLFAAFVGPVTFFGGRRRWAGSPQLARLPYQQRRAVIASIIQGRQEIDPALAPAVEEQAGRLLEGQRKTRLSTILVSIAVVLNLAGLAFGGIKGPVWPTALLAAALPVIWLREPRRTALARTALDAAHRPRGT